MVSENDFAIVMIIKSKANILKMAAIYKGRKRRKREEETKI